MNGNISNMLTNYIIRNGNIDEEDREIYEYGFQSAIAMIINTVTFFLICYIFNMFLEGVVYGILFMILRVYAGGVHLSSNIKCYILSGTVLIGTLILIKYTTMNQTLMVVFTAIACSIISFLSPVEDKNKPLDEVERTEYKRRTRTALKLDIFLFVILFLNNHEKFAYIVSILLVEMAVFMILGTMKNNMIRVSAK